MSWKQKALDTCKNWYIVFEDQSTAHEYVAVLTAPRGYLFYESGKNIHTHVMRRFKGADKSKFWYQVEQIVSTGTFTDEFYEDWLEHGAEFDRIQEQD